MPRYQAPTVSSDVAALLLREQPTFHAVTDGERTINWGVSPEVIDWIAESIPDGAVTLETGSGHSTVAFLTRSSRHIAIAPDTGERDAISNFCVQHEIPITGFEFVAQPSQLALPAMRLPALDAVLIDGEHAFPTPFLDWYYTADSLTKGGYLLVDDVNLRTGRVLNSFLRREPEWTLLQTMGKTAVFQKIVAGKVTGKWWGAQPWGSTPYPSADDDLRQLMAHLRNYLRLRTRLRSWLATRSEQHVRKAS